MQGSLFIMCILWTFRQRRLGIDEFGNPLSFTHSYDLNTGEDVGVPGLVAEEDEDPATMRVALEAALESAVEADVREGSVVMEALQEEVGEETPLLGPGSSPKEVGGDGGWLSWLSRL
jgi:hypothetical protein